MDTAAGTGPASPARRLSRRPRVTLAVTAVLLGVVIVLAVLTATSGPTKARSLPAAKSFSLPEVGDRSKIVSLKALAGQPVIINFFASWCAPCKRETPLIAGFFRAQGGKVLVIGVDSNDTYSSALAFIRSVGVRYPVGFDPFPAPVTTSYGVLALPQTFFLNAQHRVVKHVVGPVTVAQLDGWARSLASQRASK
jgi:cytochrome c biogenesis protein CcmG, thiol:disulfide interchange protein DsbE